MFTTTSHLEHLVSRVLGGKVHRLVRSGQLPPGIPRVHHASRQGVLADLAGSFKERGPRKGGEDCGGLNGARTRIERTVEAPASG